MNLKQTRGRPATALTAIAVAIALLAACGGGGGGGTTPPPPPPVASLTLVSATPANGATGVAAKGDASVKVSFTNAGTFGKSLDVLCNAKSAKTGVAESLDAVKGELTYTVSYDAPTSADCTFAYDISAKGTGGAVDPAHVVGSNSFTTEAAPIVLRYPETVYAVWTLGRVYKVAVGGVKVAVINMSSHPNAGSCGLGKVLDDGHKLANCVDPADGKLYPMAINPMDGTMDDFAGTVPADVNWVYLDTGGAHYPTWAVEAVTSTGTYYVDGLHTSTIMFQDLKGVVVTAVAGTFAVDGSVGVLQTVPEKK